MIKKLIYKSVLNIVKHYVSDTLPHVHSAETKYTMQLGSFSFPLGRCSGDHVRLRNIRVRTQHPGPASLTPYYPATATPPFSNPSVYNIISSDRQYRLTLV